jgi:hypothetical protein
MKLIVFYPVVCAHKVGCTSFKLWVPPLSFMKRRPDIKRIVHARRSFNVPTKLYKLFGPIDYYRYPERYHYPAQNWIRRNECMGSFDKAKNSKEMPPGKLQYPFNFTPDWLYRIHRFFLHIHHQDIISLTKHTLSIISTHKILNFHKWSTFERGLIHEL